MTTPTAKDWQDKAEELFGSVESENQIVHKLGLLTAALMTAYYDGANEGLERGAMTAMKAIKGAK